MKHIALKDFVCRASGNNQGEVAKKLGLSSQAAISKMIRKNRHIILTVDEVGGIHDAYEIKRIGKFAGQSVSSE